MATFSGSRLYQIFQGTPVSATQQTTILGLGPAGDALLRRRLVHPDGASFEPILYWSNPDRTFNMDNEVLRSPIASIVRTLSTSTVLRFEEVDADVVITEVWLGGENRFSMPAFLFRQLYEYLLNPPAFNPISPTYIQWSPQDKNAKTYNIEMVRLAVGGGGDATQLFDVTEFFPPGQGNPIDPLANLDEAFAVEGSGLIDRAVVLSFKIVSEV